MKFAKYSCNLLRRSFKAYSPALKRFSHVSSVQSTQGNELSVFMEWSDSIDRILADTVSSNFEFKGQWPEHEQKQFLNDMRVLDNFLTTDEEEEFLKEIEPYLKRMRYEFDHWDDVSQAIVAALGG
jgi:hypothetical protein